MTKSSTLIRPALSKYKWVVVAVFLTLLVTAYPLYLLSRYVSSFIVIEIEYRPAIEVEVDYLPEVELYENHESRDDFSDLVVEAINNAEYEIYIAMYSFNIEEILDAIKSAVDRGVDVTLIYNADRQVEFGLMAGDYKKKIDLHYLPKFRKPDDNYHMHHKFMVVDPGQKGEVLITGPWNWSHYQEDMDPNLLMVIRDKEIISSYVGEAKRLKRATFGYGKFRDLLYIPWDKKITYSNGDKVEVWFSPGRLENSLQTRIANMIEGAQSTIDVGITILDSQIVARNLLEKAQEGVKVRIVVNASTAGNEDSLIPWMRNKIEELEIENIEIYEGGTLPTGEEPEFSIYHHNMLIIDNEAVLTGTANWTFGGFFSNDENTLIFNSPQVAGKFTDIYEKYQNFLKQRAGNGLN